MKLEFLRDTLCLALLLSTASALHTQEGYPVAPHHAGVVWGSLIAPSLTAPSPIAPSAGGAAA
jgi:hypothetical protein